VHSDNDDDGEGEAAAAMMKLAGAVGETLQEAGGAGWVPENVTFSPGWRDATPAEKAGAAQLRDRLLPYFMPDRSATRLDRSLPPGRLRGSAALRAAARDSLGLPPSAEPWRHTERKIIPVPPLRAGLIMDVSGSMEIMTRVSQGIAYRFGAALSRLPDALFRGAVCGHGSAALQQKPGQVAEYRFSHSAQNIHLGMEDLAGRLDLLRRDSARLLIVISDCHLTSTREVEGTVAQVTRLTQAGCRILWLDVPHLERYGPAWAAMQQIPGITWKPIGRAGPLGPGEVQQAISSAEDALVRVMTGA
jgi:hypothetical protein